MSRIPPSTHGVLDYLTGLLLAASPWIFGFHDQHIAPQLALVFGLGTILYSLFTDYPLGLIRMLPFSAHLFLDLCVGFVLATVWLHFGVTGRAGVVFTIIGVMEFLVAIFTRRGASMKTTMS